jgi:arylsulfatase A-like enzyme
MGHASRRLPQKSKAKVSGKLTEERQKTRDVAYNEWKARSDRYNLTLNLRLIRTKRYKAIFELNSGAGEMYDLQEDPFKMVNIFGDIEYKKVEKELKALMKERPGSFLRRELPRVAVN